MSIVNAEINGSLRPYILHTYGSDFITGDTKSGFCQLQGGAALDCLIVSVVKEIGAVHTISAELDIVNMGTPSPF